METMDELKKHPNSSFQYLQSNDMQIMEVKEGYVRVEMIINGQILNIHGFIRDDVLYSFADTAAGATGFTSGQGSVTLSGTINHVKPGRGGKLIGITQKISAGRTTGVYEVLVFNDEGVLLSRMAFTTSFLDQERYRKGDRK